MPQGVIPGSRTVENAGEAPSGKVRSIAAVDCTHCSGDPARAGRAPKRTKQPGTLSTNFWKAALPYSFTLRSRSALVITETLLKLMAAAAMIGLSSRPKPG